MPTCPHCHDQNPQLGAKCPRDGGYYIPDEAVQDAQRDPLIGSVVDGKFVILSLINEGGMGAVYRALQLSVDREIAFKVLRNELRDHDQVNERFQREARAVSKLDHPNIVTMYDFGVDAEKQPYMVMEYAPGPSLASWLRREDVTLERILSVTYQILSALSAAHRGGIVHRDLKPENMIIRRAPDGQGDVVKLLDFGIARMLNETATKKLTKEGEVFGTPHYMAPEQARGSQDVGPAADVYAVGIMLHEMITGECPFDAPTPLSVLFMHINEPMPPLEPRPGLVVPDELGVIVSRATAKDPKDRYQNAQEMLADLQRFTQGAMMGAAVAPSAISGEFFRPVAATPVGQAAPVPTLQTPPQGSADPVPVYDPDATLESARAPASPASVSQRIDTAAAGVGNQRLVVVAALLVLLVGGALVAVMFLVGGDDDGTPSEEQQAARPAEPERPAPAAEPAVAVEEDEPAEAVAEPAVAAEPEPEPAARAARPAEQERPAPAEAVEVAKETSKPAAEPAAKPAPKPRPKPVAEKAPQKKAPEKKAEEKVEKKPTSEEEESGPKPVRFDRLRKSEPAAPAKPKPTRFDRL